MISIEKAYEILTQTRGVLLEKRTLKLEDSHAQYLAEDVRSPIDLPPFHQSAMDGFALSSAIDPLHRSWSNVVGAGDSGTVTLEPGQAAKIMTGARLPDGADRVEMIEKVTVDDNVISLEVEPAPWQHVRKQGSHVKKGDHVFSKGTYLGPAQIGAIASLGIAQVEVNSPLKVVVASTGNELSQPGEPLGSSGIYDSNRVQLLAQLSDLPVSIQVGSTLTDDLPSLESFLTQATQDVIILTGGVSMGDYDLVPQAATSAGFSCLFHKIQMKPGKPIWFGQRGKQVLFGLPGNPVSTYVGCHLYLKPWIRSCFQNYFEAPRELEVSLMEPVSNQGRFTFFAPFKWSGAGVEMIQTMGSGDSIRFASQDGLMKIPPQTSLQRGEKVHILLP